MKSSTGLFLSLMAFTESQASSRTTLTPPSIDDRTIEVSASDAGALWNSKYFWTFITANEFKQQQQKMRAFYKPFAIIVEDSCIDGQILWSIRGRFGRFIRCFHFFGCHRCGSEQYRWTKNFTKHLHSQTKTKANTVHNYQISIFPFRCYINWATQ